MSIDKTAPSVTAFEAKTRFGHLLERVARGEEIVITRHDRPVARIIPEGRASRARTLSAVEGIRAVREAIHARTRGRARLSDAEIRSAVEEGRP